MDATELRIGNLVKRRTKGDVLTVNLKLLTSIQRQSFIFKPIPLTEEWLLKFGLKKHPPKEHLHGNGKWDIKNFYSLNKSSHLITNYKSEGEYYWFLPSGMRSGGFNLKHVHSLQNLYFALTNKELTKK